MAAEQQAVAELLRTIAELTDAVNTLTAQNQALMAQNAQFKDAVEQLYQGGGRGLQGRSLARRGS